MYILGGAFKQWFDLRDTSIGYTDEQVGAEFLYSLRDGGLDLLRISYV